MKLERYNCDCLNADPKTGTVALDDIEGIYCERWVYLATDVEAEIASLQASREALIGALQEAIGHVQQYDIRCELRAALDAARAEEK